MTLSDLPNEILLEIADRLNDAAMNALALTNTELYNFLNEHLYRRDVTKAQSRPLTWAAKNGVEGTVQRATDACSNFNQIPDSFLHCTSCCLPGGTCIYCKAVSRSRRCRHQCRKSHRLDAM